MKIADSVWNIFLFILAVFLVYLLFFSDTGSQPFCRNREGEQLPLFSSLSWVQGEESWQKNLPTVVIGFEQWCPNCIVSIASNNKFFRENSHKYNLIGVCTELDDGLKELAQTTIEYPVAHDATGVLHSFFENNSIPFYVVLDSSSRVLYQGHRFPPEKILR